MLGDRQRHIDRAMETWPELAARLGVDPQGWTVDVLAARKDKTTFRTVLRLSRGDTSYVLKHEKKRTRGDKFRAEIDAYAKAHAAFRADDHSRIPHLRAVLPDRRAALFDYVDAPTLASRMETDTFADHLLLLERAGRWLDLYHRCRIGDRRIFRPQANLSYLRTMRDAVESGALSVPMTPQFLAATKACFAAADAYEGRETIAAHLHGDYHLKNVLAGEAIWVVDFMPDHFAPVGHDVARILVHYATLFAPQDEIPPGQILPPDAATAFFRGYQLVGEDDPSVGFLMRTRILSDWLRLTGDTNELNVPRARRLLGLQALAGIAFGT